MAHTTSLSFEVFPPKKEEEFDNIFDFLREAAKLHPDFISCTYGAGGSRAGKTIEIASYRRSSPLTPSPISPALVLPGRILKRTAKRWRRLA